MSSSSSNKHDSFYRNCTLSSWLESVLPKPSYIPPEFVEKYGPNPNVFLAQLIVDYYGSNPFYYFPMHDNFRQNYRDAIKTSLAESHDITEHYNDIMDEALSSHEQFVPTSLPHLDSKCNDEILLRSPEEQAVLQDIETSPLNYQRRYVLPFNPDETPNLSITAITTLHDGSVLMAAEGNLWLWEKHYVPAVLSTGPTRRAKNRNDTYPTFDNLSSTPILFQSFDIQNNSYNVGFQTWPLKHLKRSQQGNRYDASSVSSSDGELSFHTSDSSGDNDSDSDNTQDGGDLRCCECGHDSYTALLTIPPLQHRYPCYSRQLIQKYNISPNSPRLFVSGCASGHVTLHDATTGYRRHITTIHQTITQLALIPRNSIPRNSDHIDACKPDISSNSTPPEYPQNINGNIIDIYHPNCSELPFIVVTTKIGLTIICDPITGDVVCKYTYTQDDSTDISSEFNTNDVLNPPVVAIPLAQSQQRSIRLSEYEIQTSCYAYPNAYMPRIFPQQSIDNNERVNGVPKLRLRYSKKSLWSPFAGFPFHLATPRLNGGMTFQFDDPEASGYIQPQQPPQQEQKPRNMKQYPPQEPDPNNLTDTLHHTYAQHTIVATARGSGQVALASATSSRPHFFAYSHKQFITSLVYCGGLLWTAGWDKVIKAWDLRYLSTPIFTLHGHSRHITAMNGMGDQYIVTTGADKFMRVWDIASCSFNSSYVSAVLSDLDAWIRLINARKGQAFDKGKSHTDNNNTNDDDNTNTISKMYDVYMLPLYPGLEDTPAIINFCRQHGLIYKNNGFRFASTTDELFAWVNRTIHDPPVICRNLAARLQQSAIACHFAHEISYLVQNIGIVKDVIITCEKDCKARVGLNAYRGGFVPWRMVINPSESMMDDVLSGAFPTPPTTNVRRDAPEMD